MLGSVWKFHMDLAQVLVHVGKPCNKVENTGERRSGVKVSTCNNPHKKDVLHLQPLIAYTHRWLMHRASLAFTCCIQPQHTDARHRGMSSCRSNQQHLKPHHSRYWDQTVSAKTIALRPCNATAEQHFDHAALLLTLLLAIAPDQQP
jgi:hypothetical protein